IRFENMADVADRPLQDDLPLAVAADQGRGPRVLTQPPGQIVASDLQHPRLLPQPPGNAPCDFQTDFINYFVSHRLKISRRHDQPQRHMTYDPTTPTLTVQTARDLISLENTQIGMSHKNCFRMKS